MTITAPRYSQKSCLFYIRDSCYGYEVLVDTGTEISVIPTTTENNLTPALYKLQAANGTKIITYSGKSLRLNFGILQSFFVDFYTSRYEDTYTRIRLTNFNLSVNMATKILIYNETQLKIDGAPFRYLSTGISSTQPEKIFRENIRHFPRITTPLKHTDAVLHTVKHHIQTTGQLTHSTPEIQPAKTRWQKKYFGTCSN